MLRAGTGGYRDGIGEVRRHVGLARAVAAPNGDGGCRTGISGSHCTQDAQGRDLQCVIEAAATSGFHFSRFVSCPLGLASMDVRSLINGGNSTGVEFDGFHDGIFGFGLTLLRTFIPVGPIEAGGLNNKAASQAPSHSGGKKLDSATLYPVGELLRQKVRCSFIP